MPTAESTVITRASKEWWKRPDDERYLTLDELHAATVNRRYRSKVGVIPNDALLARGSEERGGALWLQEERLGTLYPTHWSLGQLASISHTDRTWVREIGGTKDLAPWIRP